MSWQQDANGYILVEKINVMSFTFNLFKWMTMLYAIAKEIQLCSSDQYQQKFLKVLSERVIMEYHAVTRWAQGQTQFRREPDALSQLAPCHGWFKPGQL